MVIVIINNTSVLQYRTTTIAFFLLFRIKVHFSYDFGKDLVDIGSVFGRGLNKGTAPMLGQRISLVSGHFPLMVQIRFIRYQQNWNTLGSLNSSYKLLHAFYVLERRVISQRIDYDKSLAILYVQVPHRGELLGSSSIQDLEHARRIIHFDFFSIKVLNRRIILFHKTPTNKLQCKSTFTDATRPQNNNFELTHFDSLDIFS